MFSKGRAHRRRSQGCWLLHLAAHLDDPELPCCVRAPLVRFSARGVHRWAFRRERGAERTPKPGSARPCPRTVSREGTWRPVALSARPCAAGGRCHSYSGPLGGLCAAHADRSPEETQGHGSAPPGSRLGPSKQHLQGPGSLSETGGRGACPGQTQGSSQHTAWAQLGPGRAFTLSPAPGSG